MSEERLDEVDKVTNQKTDLVPLNLWTRLDRSHLWAIDQVQGTKSNYNRACVYYSNLCFLCLQYIQFLHKLCLEYVYYEDKMENIFY